MEIIIAIVLGFLQLVTICVVMYFEYRKGSISLFLWATLLIMFGLPHLITVSSTEYDYSSSVMIEASVFVILFNLIYLITRFILLGRKKAVNLESLKQLKDFEMRPSYRNKIIIRTLLFCLCASIGIIVYTSITKYGGILSTSWGEFFETSASVYELGIDSGLAMIVAKYLVFSSGGVIIPLMLYKKYKSASLATILIIVYSLITRNRITILPAIVAILLYYISKNRQIKMKQVVFFSLSSIIVIYTVYAMRLFRHYGSIENFIMNFDFIYFNTRILEMLLTGDGELGLRDAFYYFLDHNNNFPGFGEGNTYIRLLLIFLPTGYSFDIKPSDFAITMGSAYLYDFTNTIFSMHPTLYGDCYANLWWFGVFLGVFWAIFVFLIDKISDSRRNIIIKASFMVLFGCVYGIVGRGSVYNGLYIGYISGILLLTLDLLIPGRKAETIKKAEHYIQS